MMHGYLQSPGLTVFLDFASLCIIEYNKPSCVKPMWFAFWTAPSYRQMHSHTGWGSLELRKQTCEEVHLLALLSSALQISIAGQRFSAACA